MKNSFSNSLNSNDYTKFRYSAFLSRFQRIQCTLHIISRLFKNDNFVLVLFDTPIEFSLIIELFKKTFLGNLQKIIPSLELEFRKKKIHVALVFPCFTNLQTFRQNRCRFPRVSRRLRMVQCAVKLLNPFLSVYVCHRRNLRD